MTLALADATGPPEPYPHQRIRLTREERDSQTLSASNRSLARFILSSRGYVILKDALSLDLAESLRKELTLVYQDCRETPAAVETGTGVESPVKLNVSTRYGATFWFRQLRWRVFPKLTPLLREPALLANPFVVPILEDLLGRDFTLKFVSTDTCAKGSLLQSPHRDIDGKGIFANNRWRARGYIVNVPVMECGLHNGPIEVWPGGSHMWTSELLDQFGLSLDIQDGPNPVVEELAVYFPSTRLALQPGEILIRDLAMWHRGTPNPSDQPRTMVTIGYFRRKYDYGYGDPSYNLDYELFRGLHPRIQKMYEPHFRIAKRLGRRQREIRRAVKRAGLSWVKARFRKNG